MPKRILIVMCSLWFSVYAYAAHMTTTEDLLVDLLKDGCASPIANEKVEAMAKMPASCINTFFDGKGAVDTDIMIRVRDWGSNGLGGMPWQFEDDECNEFFVSLHQRIDTYVPSLRLSPHDLFHGHILSYGPSGKDHLAVLFHAKEYPSDLEIVKNRYQISTESFSSTDDEFSDRNFLYLSHRDNLAEIARNEIFLIEQRGMCADFFSELSANSLSEGILEMVLQNGKMLGDVNVFLPENLLRIKYQFYPTVEPVLNEIIEDYEWIESGKSVEQRMIANQILENVVQSLRGNPMIYFMTGRL